MLMLALRFAAVGFGIIVARAGAVDYGGGWACACLNPILRVSVNIADREYESWFIASAEAIASHIGTVSSPVLPDNIEEIRGAKGWLAQNLLSRRYDPIDDQPAFSTYIDVSMARRRSRSFDRFCQEIERLLVV